MPPDQFKNPTDVAEVTYDAVDTFYRNPPFPPTAGLVMLEITSQGISVYTDKTTRLAFFKGTSLKYCALWPFDYRYFCLLTQQEDRQAMHVFLTDLSLCEKFVDLFGHAGFTVTNGNGDIGHYHQLRHATKIIQDLPTLYPSMQQMRYTFQRSPDCFLGIPPPLPKQWCLGDDEDG
eukprot:sb/3471897/